MLPTWQEALDQVDSDARPAHVLRFGTQLDAKGLIAPSDNADRAVRYLTKYLTKSMCDAYADPDDADPAYAAHIDRPTPGGSVAALLGTLRELAPLRHSA